MTTEENWIIGTEPPCPRCDYLTRMVKDIVTTAGTAASVRHLAYICNAARQFAASLGLQPGTAKDVARVAANQVADLLKGHFSSEAKSCNSQPSTSDITLLTRKRR